MTISYDQKDLVTFGEYVLSTRRKERIAANWKHGDSIPLEERLQTVYHADTENWKQEQLEKTENESAVLN